MPKNNPVTMPRAPHSYLKARVVPTYYLLLTTYYLLTTTYYLVLTTYYLLLCAYYLLPTTYYSHLKARVAPTGSPTM